MIRFLADENLNNDIVRGIIRRNALIDIVRVQDVGLTGAPDPQVLEWAAQQQRILLSHDVATITKYAYQRVESAQLTAFSLHKSTFALLTHVVKAL